MNDQLKPKASGLAGLFSLLRKNGGTPNTVRTYKPSQRELDILDLLSLGLNSKEIGDRLNISEHTVSTHRKRLIQKTGCKNTVDLVASCIREGLI